jgi:myosin-crossreactive antigen
MSEERSIRSPALAVYVLSDVIRELEYIAKEHVNDKEILEEVDKLVDQARQAIEYLMSRLDFKTQQSGYSRSYGYSGRGGGSWQRRGRGYGRSWR